MVIEVRDERLGTGAAYTTARCRCGTVAVVIGGPEQITPEDTRAGLEELLAHARMCLAAADDDEHQDDEHQDAADPAAAELAARLFAERYRTTPLGRTQRMNALVAATPIIVDMIDATAANAFNIPEDTPIVAGYDTGPGVDWPTGLWARFPNSGQVHIEQDPAAASPLQTGRRVLDVEKWAATIGDVAKWVRTRMDAGPAYEWSTLYADDNYMSQARLALDQAGPPGWYYGHVDCWFADWNLNADEAAALVGTLIHGFTCRAVQYASPTSNAGTIVPGGTLTLSQALVDLSKADARWAPRPFTRPPVLWALDWPATSTAAPSLFELVSTDGGKTYS